MFKNLISSSAARTPSNTTDMTLLPATQKPSPGENQNNEEVTGEEKKSNENANEGGNHDEEIPELILPSANHPRSFNNERSDASIETTSSQSIDLSYLLKNLEREHHDIDSLSLGVSFDDIDCNIDIVSNGEDRNNDIKQNNLKRTEVGAHSENESPNDVLAIVNVGGQLFRESLVADEEEREPNSTTSTAVKVGKKEGGWKTVGIMANKSFATMKIAANSTKSMPWRVAFALLTVGIGLSMLSIRSYMGHVGINSPQNCLEMVDLDGMACQVPRSESEMNIQDKVDNAKDEAVPISSRVSDSVTAETIRDDSVGSIIMDHIVILDFSWPAGLLALFVGSWISLQSVLARFGSSHKKTLKKKLKAPMSPSVGKHRCSSEGTFLTPPPKPREPTDWMSPCYGEGALDISMYESMKVVDLRELLRGRKCDNRGTKQQMIKMLVQSYQNELACLTVEKLRPKLRKHNLSQKGSKKDIIRRLVEAGPL